MEPAPGHWSMTVLRRGLPTHCLLWRTTPPRAPLGRGSTIFQTSENFCSALEAFPSIPSAFQKEIHQNGISPNYYRIQLDSGKGPKSFHVGKTKAGVTMKKVTWSSFVILSKVLSSFSLLFISFRFQPLLCLTLAMDRQLVSGSQSRWKMQIHLFLTTFVLFHSGKFSLLMYYIKFAMKTCFILQETKFVPVGAVNKPTSTKEAENRYLGS